MTGTPEVATTEAPFRRRTLGWVIGLTTLSFLIALTFVIFGDDIGTVPSADSDSYSRSALGHRGFVALMQDYGIPVTQSRHASGARAGERAVLLIAEPHVSTDEAETQLADMLATAAHTVLVLPKRTGEPDPMKRAWIEDSGLVDTAEATRVLSAAGIPGEVVRPPKLPALTVDEGVDLPYAPVLDEPQLVRLSEDSDAVPLVYSDDGALVFELELDDGQQVIVLSDPDLIANHGLARGDNAALALGAVERWRPTGAVVVIDETLHGHVAVPSLWRELFSFPLSLASLSVLVALAVLLWSATGRFGKPRPAAPAVAPGKRFLIDNTAELIRFGGHSAHALERYLHATVQEVARASHAPAHLGPGELRDWLLRAAKARQVDTDLAALEREVAEVVNPDKPHGSRAAARALAAAHRIHRWRQEMTNGSAGHSRAS